MKNQNLDTGFWTSVFGTVSGSYKHFIPAIVLTWVIVEVVASHVPKAPWVAQVGLFLLCLDYYLAAAARAAGVREENPLSLALGRTGMCIEPMILAFGLGMFSFSCFMVFLFQKNVFVGAAAITVAVFVNLYAFALSWPLWGVPFFFEGKIRWSPAGRGSVWQGPGLNLALRVTKEYGFFNVHSRRFLLGITVLSILGIAIKWFLPGSLLFDVIIYPLGIPVLSVVVIYGTRELLGDRFVEID